MAFPEAVSCLRPRCNSSESLAATLTFDVKLLSAK
jgi:hypothetical protein